MTLRLVAVSLALPLVSGVVACQGGERGETKSSASTAEVRSGASESDFDFDSDGDDCRREQFLPTEPGEPMRRQRPDRELRKILREIDHNQVEHTIQMLASFRTRHTLSSQTDPLRGIGAPTQSIFDTLS